MPEMTVVIYQNGRFLNKGKFISDFLRQILVTNIRIKLAHFDSL